MNKNFMIFAVSFLATFYTSMFLNSVHAKEAPKKDELPICDTRENTIKTLTGQKYFPLLNMTNKENVIETIWVSGQSIAITATPPKTQANAEDTVCLIAMMKDVVYNSDTIEGLYKVFEAQMQKEKGI